MKFIIAIILFVFTSQMHGQFQLQNTNLGETTSSMRAISVGAVANDGDIASRLHINNFVCSSPTGGLNGLLLRTDGDEDVDNYWQMFTGSDATTQTERFRIRTHDGGYDTWLERTQSGSEADIRLLTAQIEIRARNKRLGDFCEVAGAAEEIRMGDGSDVNFTAFGVQRRLFLQGNNGFVGLGHQFSEIYD